MHPSGDEIVQRIDACKTAEEVAQIMASPVTQERVSDLISRAKGNGLEAGESAELDSYMELEHVVRMAKARAYLRLGGGRGRTFGMAS